MALGFDQLPHGVLRAGSDGQRACGPSMACGGGSGSSSESDADDGKLDGVLPVALSEEQAK